MISRVGVISPAARGAAQRKEAQGLLERQWREERKAQWMYFLAFFRLKSKIQRYHWKVFYSGLGYM